MYNVHDYYQVEIISVIKIYDHFAWRHFYMAKLLQRHFRMAKLLQRHFNIIFRNTR